MATDSAVVDLDAGDAVDVAPAADAVVVDTGAVDTGAVDMGAVDTGAVDNRDDGGRVVDASAPPPDAQPTDSWSADGLFVEVNTDTGAIGDAAAIDAAGDTPSTSSDGGADAGQDSAAADAQVADAQVADAQIADAQIADATAKDAQSAWVPADKLPLDGPITWPAPAPAPAVGSLPGCKGGFVAVPASELPLPPTPTVKGVTIAPGPHSGGLLQDLDGDGDTDVLRWGGGGAVRVYERTAAGLDLMTPSAALQAGVGHVRLAAAQTLVRNNAVRTLLIGATAAWWLTKTASGWQLQVAPTFAGKHATAQRNAVVCDVDADGLLDVILTEMACGVAHPVKLFLARPDGAFSLAGPIAGISAPGAYWQALCHDADGDGDVDLMLLSDACGTASSQVFARQTGRDASGIPTFTRSTPHPIFAHPTAKMPYASPMGAVAGDLDGDAFLDVVLSGDGVPLPDVAMAKLAPPAMLPWVWLIRTLALRGRKDGAFVDIARATGLAGLIDPVKKLAMIGWGVALLDVDRDRWPDVLIAHGDDYDTATLGSRGPMRPVLLRNAGSTQMIDVSASIGLPPAWSGHAVSVGDLDDDNDLDILVGGEGGPPLLLRNMIEHSHHSVRVRLHGTLSNPVGAHARVWVTANGVTRYVEIGADGGFGGQHERIADFGIGSATAASVKVRWPSGLVQLVDSVKIDQLVELTEPTVAALTTRILPKAASAVLTITPQALVASGAASVAVQSYPAGAITGAGALQCSKGGVCAFTLSRAPTAKAGSVVRLKITIAGAVLGVWPSLWLP